MPLKDFSSMWNWVDTPQYSLQSAYLVEQEIWNIIPKSLIQVASENSLHILWSWQNFTDQRCIIYSAPLRRIAHNQR